jgi:hypothetical protein
MQRYLEIRTTSATNSTAGADLARHLLSRQHLGKTVVVCDKPVIIMSVIRKYWLRLSRNLQKERASTLNAEKILQLTYDITHMQHMGFVARPCYDVPHADVFFVTPDELTHMPANCFSLYILSPPSHTQLAEATKQLPERSLVVDYSHSAVISNALLTPKHQLEQLVPQEWQKVDQFFHAQHINIQQVAANTRHAGAVDEAIDVILNTSNQFLRVADDFLLLLRQAQPLQLPNPQQQLYDLLATLQRRIYSLTPGNLSQQFAQAFGDDEPAAHDVTADIWSLVGELQPLQQAHL